MPNPSNALVKTMTGLYKDFKNEGGAPVCLRFAPLVGQDVETGVYQTLSPTNAKIPNTQDPALNVGWGAQYRRADVDYAQANVTIERVAGKYMSIPDRVVRSLEGTNPELDPLRDAMEVVTPPLHDKIVSDFLTTATAGFTDAGTIDLTEPGEQLASAFRDAMLDIQKTVGSKPTGNWFVYLGPEARNLLLTLDELRNSDYAFSVGSGDTARQYGVIQDGVPEQWFRQVVGCELLTEQWVNRTGATGAFAVTTQCYLGYCPPGMSDGPIKTFFQRLNRGGGGGSRTGTDIVEFYSDQATIPEPQGTLVAADAAYGITTISPEYARKFTLTIA